MFGISVCTLTVIYLWRLTSLISPARALIIFVSYVSCAGVSPQTPLTRLSEHLFTVGSTIATESWLACHKLRSVGFNPFSVQQLALCCSYQAGPVSRSWCVCSSDPLAFDSTEDSVQAAPGSLQVSSSHGADILMRSLLCVPISSLEGRSHLWLAAAGDLRIPSAKTVTIGRRGFSVASPAAWNNLSTTLKDYTLTFTAFKKLFKTELL